MKQQFKRILSVFLIFAMIVSFFPMQIKAADLEEDLPADDSSQEVEAIEPEQDATDNVDVQRGNVAFTTLSGTVVDASGNGMQGVSVVLYNYDENMLLPQCFTDSNGAWSSVEFDVLVGYTYLRKGDHHKVHRQRHGDHSPREAGRLSGHSNRRKCVQRQQDAPDCSLFRRDHHAW